MKGRNNVTNTTRRKIGWIAVALGIIAMLWLVMSPYTTLYTLQRAAKEVDAETLNAHIDYPRLRESLKGQMMAAAMRASGPNDLGVGGEALAAAIGGQMIDTMVRPETVTALIQRAHNQQQRGNASANKNGENLNQRLSGERTYNYDRTGIKSFEVSDTDDRAAGLFELQGTRWMLVGVRLPTDQSPNAS